MILKPTGRKRAFTPFRGGTPSVPVGVDGLPVQAVTFSCHNDHVHCPPYADGRLYGDGELYCAEDEGRGFYLSLCEVEPHYLSVRIQHSNGTRLLIDTIKPYLAPNPRPRPYQHQVDVDTNCPQHLGLRIVDSSGSQLIVYRTLVFANRRRNRPVA